MTLRDRVNEKHTLTLLFPMATTESALLPPTFAAMAEEMPLPLKRLLVENAETSSIAPADLASALPFLPLALPMGSAADVVSVDQFIDADGCAALRNAVDEHGLDAIGDTVDGAADHQLNLTSDELVGLLGSSQVERIVAAAVDLQRSLRHAGPATRGSDEAATTHSGGSSLPIVEAFVRRYTAHTRPWHPFHQDRAAITVNVALSDDHAHGGGRLVGLFADGAAKFERREGTATIHRSQIVHGVTCMTRGVRHALIVFLGHEPAVRRVLVRGEDGVERWDRVLVVDEGV